MKVLLQFQEGLKKYALNIAKKLEKEGYEVFISGSPCYGACDIALDEAKAIKADKIIHIGHNKFVKHELEIEVEYWPFPIDFPLDVLKKAIIELSKMEIKSINLVTTIQHIHQIEEMKKMFEENNIKVYTSKGFYATENGQILGCDSKAANGSGEAVVFIGDGLFHALGIETNKRIFLIDRNGLKDITHIKEKIEKKRKANLIMAYNAQKFGILVSTKVGQFNLLAAKTAKKILEEANKEAYIFVSNEIMASSLYNFNVDCYINTACPRIIDDTELFGKPIINMNMLFQLKEMWKSAKKFESNNAVEKTC